MSCQEQLMLDLAHTPPILAHRCQGYDKGSQLQAEPYLRMSWVKRQHGSQIANLTISVCR